MIENQFLDYLLDQIDSKEERQQIDLSLRTQPDLSEKLIKLKQVIAPLAFDMDSIAPPDDLAMRTIALIAEVIVSQRRVSEADLKNISANKTSHATTSPTTQVMPIILQEKVSETGLERNQEPSRNGVYQHDHLSLSRSSALKSSSNENSNLSSELPDLNSNRLVYPAYLRSQGEDGAGKSVLRRNLLIGLLLSFFAFSVAIPMIMYYRDQHQVTVCENNLRIYYQSIAGYAAIHQNRLPFVQESQTAGTFLHTLSDGGLLPPAVNLNCPVSAVSEDNNSDVPFWNRTDAGEIPILFNYAYTLGYRDANGQLHGMKLDANTFATPILADAPHPSRCGFATNGRDRSPDKFATAINHSQGQNVLFSNGNVTFFRQVNIGLPEDDNIFCNQNAQNKAGIYLRDIVLGRADEYP